jgi:hypothetical protein
MDISTSSNNVTIKGNIKTINDFQAIKTALDGVAVHNKEITVSIVDSISITSSVIGFFNKLVLKDGIRLQLNVGSSQLIELLDDLNLASTFHAKKI